MKKNVVYESMEIKMPELPEGVKPLVVVVQDEFCFQSNDGFKNAGAMRMIDISYPKNQEIP